MNAADVERDVIDGEGGKSIGENVLLAVQLNRSMTETDRATGVDQDVGAMAVEYRDAVL